MMQLEEIPAKQFGPNMNRKAYLKDPYFDFRPKPFTRLDYLLCTVVFLLLAVASIPQLATVIAGQ